MRILLDAEQMRKCDNYTTEHFGISSVVLMERAALATFISICNTGKMYEDSKTLIICGTGNNGADGLALARIFFEGGYDADFCVAFDEGRHSELYDRQLDTLSKYGLKPISFSEIEDKYDIVIDAMFGIGLSRNLSEERIAAIEKLNSLSGFHVAMDIPSGINADTGAVMGAAFAADLTVTYGFAKKGMILDPGRGYTGQLLIANIGITDRSLEAVEGPLFRVPETEDIVKTLPKRSAGGNKGTFGKVLIYAGSEKISGACALAGLAAFKAGAGMVKIITSEANADIVKKILPEAMVTAVSLHNSAWADIKDDVKADIKDDVAWSDVILAGPGIGTGEEAREVLALLADVSGDRPLVIDADGLNIISADKELREKIKNRSALTVMTPHLGELSRLTGLGINKIKEDLCGKALDFAGKENVILVAKDSVSVVTDGSRSELITSGNSGMATAGSGDVLSGIIAALLGNIAGAKGVSAKTCKEELFNAVRNAAYIHGMAGSACLEDMAEDSVTAGDIIAHLQSVIKDIRDEQKSKERV